MEKKKPIARYSADDLACDEKRTDWAKVDATSPEDVKRQADEDGRPTTCPASFRRFQPRLKRLRYAAFEDVGAAESAGPLEAIAHR